MKLRQAVGEAPASTITNNYYGFNPDGSVATLPNQAPAGGGGAVDGLVKSGEAHADSSDKLADQAAASTPGNRAGVSF